MADFPQELIDAIIDEVPDSGLAACSLTSTAFVPSSQRRLFRWMSLRDLGAYERTALLLASSPHRGQYVRYLALEIKNIPADYAQLKAILALLPGIERLSIGGGQECQIDLAENPYLNDLLSAPSIKCFALNHLVVPSALISRAFSSFEQVTLSLLTITHGAELFELPLSQLSITDDNSRVSEGGTPPAGLWHLNIISDQFSTMLFSVLQPTILGRLRHLVRLSIVYPPVPESLQTQFTQLLTMCSGTLEHLALELEAPLNLPALPVLVSMELWLDVDLAKTPPLLASIVSQTAACAPHIEVLALALMDRPKRPPQCQLPFTPSAAEWPALDSALMDMQDLQEVDFSLRHFTWNAERYNAFVPYIEQKLPQAFDAELLQFSQYAAIQHPMDCFME